MKTVALYGELVGKETFVDSLGSDWKIGIAGEEPPTRGL